MHSYHVPPRVFNAKWKNLRSVCARRWDNACSRFYAMTVEMQLPFHQWHLRLSGGLRPVKSKVSAVRRARTPTPSYTVTTELILLTVPLHHYCVAFCLPATPYLQKLRRGADGHWGRHDAEAPARAPRCGRWVMLCDIGLHLVARSDQVLLCMR